MVCKIILDSLVYKIGTDFRPRVRNYNKPEYLVKRFIIYFFEVEYNIDVSLLNVNNLRFKTNEVIWFKFLL